MGRLDLEGPDAPGARDGGRRATDPGRVPRRYRNEPPLRARAARGPRPARAPAADGCRPPARPDGARAHAPASGRGHDTGRRRVTRPVGIVLAGGASSRFGRDKVTAEYDGRPLVHHALERLASVTDR